MKLLCKKTPRLNAMIPGKYYILINNILLVDGNDGYSWYFTFTTTKKSYWYIWNYFYTPQEERKIKLEKLYETTL